MLAAALVVLCTAPANAQSNERPYYLDVSRLLTHEQILQEIPGRWAMLWPDKEGERPRFDCKNRAVRIWIERDQDGGAVYFSQHHGSDEVARSPVFVDKGILGSPKRQIRVRYDNEKRLTDDGKPVEWELIMPDRLTFMWRRTDWPKNSSTPISRRCAEEESVS